MLNIAICEDDREWLLVLIAHIKSYCMKNKIDIDCSCFSSAEEFLNTYTGKEYEIVFLDVEMGEMDGISLSRRIWEMDKKTAIIFATGNAQYMEEALQSHPFHYLLKPIGKEKINKVLDDYFKIVAIKGSKIKKNTTKIKGKTTKNSYILLYLGKDNGGKIIKETKANSKGKFTLKKLNIKKYSGKKICLLSYNWGCRMGKIILKVKNRRLYFIYTMI